MTAAPTHFTPLKLLTSRLAANVAALATRHADLARNLERLKPSFQYGLVISGNEVTVGYETPAGVTRVPSTLPPSVAAETAHRLFPTGACDRSALIVGEDLGWLWNAAYRFVCKVAVLPTHRPPLYFLIGDVEQLWLILHIHDWTDLLADPRVILFVGRDSVERFRGGMVTRTMLPWPMSSIVVDNSLWPTALSLNDVRDEAQRSVNDRLATLRHVQQLTAIRAEPMGSERPLRIMGICSRYTTFLQHSMRDWLAGFSRLGHQTHLVMESSDHELPGTLAVAEACLDFQPDLVVAIDHYREELVGIPEDVPVVMWVQDYLPNIFSTRAGAAQGDRDYTLGFAGLKLVYEFGYPADRFVPALVGVDEVRFSNQPCAATELDALRCEASFVSHASKPAEVMLKAEIDRLNSPAATRLLAGVFDRLRAVYEGGNTVTEPVVIERMIQETMLDTATTLLPPQCVLLTGFFSHGINNALFRHQSLQWLADAGVDLRLYGNGWESHPTLGKFARGPAAHGEHLRQIYQASAINLQITPHGALHQRLFEGLAAGGFFLIRHVPGDQLERHLMAIAQWCDRTGVGDDRELRARATPAVKQSIAAVAESLQLDPFTLPYPLIDQARWSQTTGCVRSAGSVFNEDYDAVAFGNKEELLQKTTRLLSDASARQQIAGRMRAVVVRRFTYTATCQRLMDAITADRNGIPRRMAA